MYVLCTFLYHFDYSNTSILLQQVHEFITQCCSHGFGSGVFAWIRIRFQPSIPEQKKSAEGALKDIYQKKMIVKNEKNTTIENRHKIDGQRQRCLDPDPVLKNHGSVFLFYDDF